MPMFLNLPAMAAPFGWWPIAICDRYIAICDRLQEGLEKYFLPGDFGSNFRGLGV
jgi:hypothetical protein